MNDDAAIQLGRLIRQRRQVLALSQPEAAVMMGVNESTLSKRENGSAGWPHPKNLRIIQEVLGISGNDIARCKGEAVQTWDLRDAPWRANREMRRSRMHPQIEGAPLPLVATDSLNQITDTFARSPSGHFLVEGDIASGKSSLLELAIDAWQDVHPSGEVYVMPLGGDYYTGDRWRTSEALLEFLDRSRSLSKTQSQDYLLVIEDAHELHRSTLDRYLLDNGIDLSNIWLIVSSRPKYVEKVRQDISKWAGGVELTHIRTSARETSDIIINAAISDGAERQAFRLLAMQMGYSLIALSAALYAFALDRSQPVTSQLSFKAIEGELTRIVDPEGGNATIGEATELKLGLMVAWMLGGLESAFGKAELEALLDMTDVQNLLQMLENNKEIFETEEGVFRSGRHPAWGLLVMRAVDEAQGLETLSGVLRSRMLHSSKRKDLQVKTLTAYLFAMLYHRIMPPDELGFMCSGRHMHEEFAEAGNFYLQAGVNYRGEIPQEERLKALLEIASGTRRSKPNDCEQRQRLIDTAKSILAEATTLAYELSDAKEDADLNGHLLYEVAYWHSLHGDFDRARQYFRWSRLKEFRDPKRRQEGVMSGVRESIMSSYLGDRTEAGQCLREIETVLGDLLKEEETDRLLRFKANLLHAKLEMALSGRFSDEAEKAIERYVKAAERTASIKDRALYGARVALLREDFAGARDLASEALSQQINAQSAEHFNACYRILGDGYLGQDLPDAAREAYQKLWNDWDHPPRHLDFEMQLILGRMKKLSQGMSGLEIIRTSPV